MAIDFPTSPTVGQQYSFNGVTYTFTSQGTWVVASSGGGGGTGNVSNSGTPAANEFAQWVTSTTIKGVAASATGFVQKTGDTMTGNLTIANSQPTITLSPTSGATKTFAITQLGDVAYFQNSAASNPIILNLTTDVMSFTNSPVGPTPTAGDNSTKLATTAFVHTGVTNGSNAAAGVIGEYVESTSGAIGVAANTATAIHSLSFAAGDWDIWGVATISGATGGTFFFADLSTTAGYAGILFERSAIVVPGAGIGDNQLPMMRKNFTTSTTMNIGTFVGSACTVTAKIMGRRRR